MCSPSSRWLNNLPVHPTVIMNALASASTLRPAAAARQSRTERRDGRLQAAAVAQWRPSPTSPSSPMTLSSVVVGSSLRPARSDNTSSSPPRAASSRRRERPRSAEAADLSSSSPADSILRDDGLEARPSKEARQGRWRGSRGGVFVVAASFLLPAARKGRHRAPALLRRRRAQGPGAPPRGRVPGGRPHARQPPAEAEQDVDWVDGGE